MGPGNTFCQENTELGRGELILLSANNQGGDLDSSQFAKQVEIIAGSKVSKIYAGVSIFKFMPGQA